MPLGSVAELPGSFRDVCQGTVAFWALAGEGRLLRQRDFERNGVHPLILMVVPSYQIVLSGTRTVRSAQDFAGLKIRTAGAGMDMMVRALGATPLRLAAPEMYEAMARGTLDGAMTQYQSVFSYKLEALLRSGTVAENFGSIAFTYVIGEARWRTLPPDLQAILAEQGRKLSLEACRLLDRQEAAARARAEAAGMRPVVLSEADRQGLVAVYGTVRRDWAAALDRHGQPGSQILAEWEAALAAAEPTQ
jgi:TRAP-type C4-dicarboxylate transport system substrate-binding protein